MSLWSYHSTASLGNPSAKISRRVTRRWHRPRPFRRRRLGGLMEDALDPTRTALVVFDMLECYRPRVEAAGAVEPIRRLIAACREYDIPICYARADHRLDGADANRTVTDTDEAFRPWGPDGPEFRFPHPPETRVVMSEFAPQAGDYDIPKHRWSAFHQTSLDLSLRSRGIDTVLLVGGSTHVGIASTAYAARDRDYQVVIVRDGLTGYEPQRSFFADQVFPRMCRVRTVDQVAAVLAGHRSTAAR
ncbi:MAG: isochorismatase family protein [Propionibacteriales bacterium]|nr:isochorismatase family protein [Propionibacteriales bacterium]